ncbi:MAG TPA: hypothetical protein VEL47_03075 [Myxococcota bacterium]|nr:hypothetical protein [Myxococcota bacterium]
MRQGFLLKLFIMAAVGCVIAAHLRAADAPSQLLTAEASDQEIAKFFSAFVNGRVVRFIHYFDIVDPAIFDDAQVDDIYQEINVLDKRLSQVRAKEAVAQTLRINQKAPSKRLVSLFSDYLKLTENFIGRLDTLSRAAAVSVRLADSDELTWLANGDVVVGRYDGKGMRELITFEASFTYIPMADDWCETACVALVAIGQHMKDCRAYKKEIHPMLVKQQDGFRAFARANAFDLNRIFVIEAKSKNVVVFGHRHYSKFLADTLELYRSNVSDHMGTKSRFLHDTPLVKKLNKHFKTGGILQPISSTEIYGTMEQKNENSL